MAEKLGETINFPKEEETILGDFALADVEYFQTYKKDKMLTTWNDKK